MIRRALAIPAAFFGVCAFPSQAQNIDPLAAALPEPAANMQGAASTDLPLYLQVYLNGQDLGVVAAFTLHLGQNRMSATREELAGIGIRASGPANRLINLDTLPGVKFRYEEGTQAIVLQVDPVSLLPRVISAATPEEQLVPSRDTGMVLNYAIAAQVGDSGLGAFSSTLGAWIYSPYGTLNSAGFFTYLQGGKQKFIRQSTAYVATDRADAITFTLGDFISSSVDWSRPIRMGGFQIQRDFSLRSDLVTNQLLSFSGAAAVPSTVDVFIQNNRAFTTNVPAGPFQLDDLPSYSGSGDAEIVIRDQQGRVVRKSVSFFAAQDLLKPGRADYSLNIGFAREAYGLESNRYGGALVASGSLRVGVTDWMTLELHGEGKSGLSLVGAGATVVPFSLAEVSLATGFSLYQDKRARFLRGTLRAQIAGIDLNISSFRTEAGFADLAYATGVDYLGAGGLVNDASLLEFPTSLDVISLSAPVNNDRRLGVSYVNSQRASGRDQLVQASYGFSLAEGFGSFVISASRNFVSDENRMSLEFSIPLGNRAQAQSAISTNGKGRAVSGVYVSRPLSEVVGDYGYSLQFAQSGQGTNLISGRAQYRSRYGKAGIEAFSVAHQRYALGTFDGAVVLGGGHLAFGNTVQDSFAIVDVGVPNVPVYLQNRAVTRTGPGGQALVPGLSSYRRNRVSISLDDLPSGTQSGVTAMDVVPARSAGSFVDFNAVSVPSATVVLRTASGALLAPGTEAYFNGSNSPSYVGYDGLTYFAGVKAVNRVTAKLDSGPCSGQFAQPPAPDEAEPSMVICQ